jgi:hypothetical protein
VKKKKMPAALEFLPVHLTDWEIDDLLSALSYFIREYPEALGTKRDMKRISKKLWAELRSRRGIPEL